MRYHRKKLIRTLLLYTVMLCYMILLDWLNYPQTVNKFNASVALIISLYLFYSVRKRPDLLIVMLCILYENYSIVVGCYLDISIRPSWIFQQFSNPRVYGIAALSLLFFEITLLVGYRNRNDNEYLFLTDIYRENDLIMWGCIALYIVLFVTQVDFSMESRASSSVFNEYKFIFVIIGGLYSKRTKFNRMIWTIVVGVTSVATFFGGNRVNTLCNVFVLAVIWYREFITLKRVVIISVPAVFLMLMIGVMRQNLSISFESIQLVLRKVRKDKLVADSFTFAFGPTIAAEEMGIELGLLEKVDLLIKNVLYVFIGGSYGKYSLSNYTRDYYMHYFGFLGANYFDLWLGALGGIVSGCSVNRLLIYEGNRKESSSQVIAMGVLANTLRWYNYNFMQIYRTALLVFVAWHAAKVIDRAMRKKNSAE